MLEKRKRNIIIFSLCGVLLLMTIGYAAFNTLLTINGTTSITSNWDIKITNITSKDIVGDASDVESQVVDDLSATFKVSLVSPGDSITYDVTVENDGTFDAYLSKITINKKDNPAIIFESSGLKEYDELSPQESKVLTIKVTYNPDTTEDPEDKSADFKIELDFNQDMKATPEISYRCPGGYSASGGSGPSLRCTRTKEASPVLKCPSNYKQSGNICYNPSDTKVASGSVECYWCSSCQPYEGLSPGSYACGTYTPPNCGSGYVSTGSAASSTRMCGAYVCSIGRISCAATVNSDSYWQCPQGYTSSGSGQNMKCSTTETTSPQQYTTYTCPDGYRLEEEKCYKE